MRHFPIISLIFHWVTDAEVVWLQEIGATRQSKTKMTPRWLKDEGRMDVSHYMKSNNGALLSPAPTRAVFPLLYSHER